MSTPSVLPGRALPPSSGGAPTVRPSLRLLSYVELRKTADTRAGKWLLASMCLLIVIAIAQSLVRDADQNFQGYLQTATSPFAYIGPVLGLLVVTSEWSQGTALTTFTLTPQRGRVLAAKFLAAIALATLFLAAALLTAGLATLIGQITGRQGMGGALPVTLVLEIFLQMVISFTLGVAFGLLLVHSALAIVCFFLLPLFFGLLTLAPALKWAHWLDILQATGALGNGDVSGHEWARVAGATLAWVVLPSIAGAIRMMRREIK